MLWSGLLADLEKTARRSISGRLLTPNQAFHRSAAQHVLGQFEHLGGVAFGERWTLTQLVPHMRSCQPQKSTVKREIQKLAKRLDF